MFSTHAESQKLTIASINLGRTLLYVAMAVLLSTVFVASLSRNEVSAALLSATDMNDFCTAPPPAGTQWGYYDLMYIGNGNSSQTVTITNPAATTASITFKIETWFCKNRAAAIDTHSYEIVEQGSTTDLVVWKSSSSWALDSRIDSSAYSPWPPADNSIDHIAHTDAVEWTDPTYGHKRMVTPTISARVDISDWSDGETKTLCPTHDVKSYYSVAWDTPVTPRCTNIRLVYDFPWSTTATTNMELRRVGDASFSSASDGTVVYPGDVLRWSSDVTIDNIFAGGPTIDTSQRRYGASSATRNGTLTFTSSPNTRTAAANAQYIVVSGDAGDDICEFLRWSPVSSSDSNSDDSDAVCAKVGYLPDLEPQPPVVPQATALPDTTLNNISASVDNNGSTQSEPNVTAAVVRFVVKSNFAAPADASGDVELTDNSNYRCDIAEEITSHQTDCQPIGIPYVGTFPSFPISTQITSGQTDNLSLIGSLTFGDRVCYVTVVNKYEKDKDAFDWRYSKPTCVVIKKTPTVHVWGNDVRVGSALDLAANQNSIIHSRVLGSSPSYGSWSEYGAIAPGDIINFASGSGLYADGAGSPSPNQSAWSNLTFANTPSYGGFVSDAEELGTLPRIEDWIFRDVDYEINSAGSHNINFGSGWPNPHANNTTVVIRADSVIIMKDIIRPSGYGSVEDMPQMIIIANDILIKKSVTQIDAWLVASGTINTCGRDGSDNPVSSPNTQQCDNDQLTINGPIVANKLRLFRTFGAGSEAELKIPAEIINFSADSYVWARHQAEQSGGLRTVAIRELPPRF